MGDETGIESAPPKDTPPVLSDDQIKEHVEVLTRVYEPVEVTLNDPILESTRIGSPFDVEAGKMNRETSDFIIEFAHKEAKTVVVDNEQKNVSGFGKNKAFAQGIAKAFEYVQATQALTEADLERFNRVVGKKLDTQEVEDQLVEYASKKLLEGVIEIRNSEHSESDFLAGLLYGREFMNSVSKSIGQFGYHEQHHSKLRKQIAQTLITRMKSEGKFKKDATSIFKSAFLDFTVFIGVEHTAQAVAQIVEENKDGIHSIFSGAGDRLTQFSPLP